MLCAKMAYRKNSKRKGVNKMKYEQGTNKSWLESCPVNDCNFKPHLKAASVDELQELVNELPEQGNKSKIRVLQTE